MTVLRYQNNVAHPFHPFFAHSEDAQTAWRPAAQVLEEVEQYVVRLDVPGVPRDQIELTVENRVLTVRGERDVATSDEAHYVSNEREGGAFERRFKLPQNADVENISAAATDGVLQIGIAKLASAAVRTIDVN